MSKEIQTIKDSVFTGKKRSSRIDTMIRIMEHFHYTIFELREIPIPTYEYMIAYLNKLDAKKK